MEFEESLNQVAAKVRDLKEGIETEEATKNAFIMPFIGQVLGYDVFNPTEVVPEFTADVGVKKGEKVDYALVHDGQVQDSYRMQEDRRTAQLGERKPAVPVFRGDERAHRRSDQRPGMEFLHGHR